MSNLQVWVHLVWGTKKRKPFLTREIRQDVFNHIRENAKSKNIYIDFINGHKDHVYVLVSMNTDQKISDVVRLIKGESSFWINRNKLTREKFEWQKRYWGVSIGITEINRIRNYIKNQEEHHRYQDFDEEVDEFIEKYGLEKFEDE